MTSNILAFKSLRYGNFGTFYVQNSTKRRLDNKMQDK